MSMKATLSFLCFLMIFLSSACWIVSVPAAPESSSCADYLTAYLSAVDAYNTALEAAQRAEIAYLEAIPGSYPIPSNLKHLVDEYDSDPEAFIKKWKEGVSVHQKIPGVLSGLLEALNTVGSLSDTDALKRARTEAKTAYDSAVTALNAAKKALEDCQGVTVVTIYCERGASCQSPPGVQRNPKAHQVFDCPDKISGLLGVRVDCPGTWWSCDGVNKCPRSEDHVAPNENEVCRGPCKQEVGSLYGRPNDMSHQTICTEDARYSETVRINGEDYIRKGVARCPQGSYWHCNIGLACPNSGNHYTGSETVTEKYIDSNGNEVPNPATPLACGHAVGSKGIHLQVSCEFCSEQFYFCAEGSEHGLARCPRNENGETCTVSGGRMILCADPPHVHQYPSAPKQTQADAAPTSESNTDKNDGKTPKQTGASKEMVLAACGVHTIEKGSSSAHSHREVSCRLDGYGNACDPGSYYVCQEDEHRHQYPNTPKGFRKVIVCPAHAWTGCKGTKSHAETCPAGHSYYTCNKAATAAHEAHTASDAPSSPPQQNPDPNNEGGDSSEGVRVCGHPKSMGGDHTFVSSCSATNANGDTCQRTSGYWPCRGQHTHKFPEPEARRKCGHLKSASGDHSFIASCPATNANGDTCQRTSGYWPCKGQHTHLFPESSSSSSSSSSSANNNNDDTDDDDSDSDSDPDDTDDDADENLVKCGRPKCGSMVSSASAHKSTCGRGHSYWSCKTEAVAAHLNH